MGMVFGQPARPDPMLLCQFVCAVQVFGAGLVVVAAGAAGAAATA